jgi:hypothetical protein
MKNEIAPVAFFVFNRPALTAQAFERIHAAKPHRLLVAADGPRPERPDDARLCEATRKIVSNPDWPCELITDFADEHLGARRRISSGLDLVFDQCPEAIILEDDCLPCPSFFSFCSTMLNRYRDDPRIMHIGGDNFQNGLHRGQASYFFSRYSLSWGWASWSRAWRHYDVTLSLWPKARKEQWLASILDDPLEIEYWTRIFDQTYRDENEAWDYQWLFACWTQNGLSILPNENLVTNIGVGPDSLHFKEGHSTIGIPTHELDGLVHPESVARDKEADRYTFDRHIGRNMVAEDRGWFRKMRKRIALRTRAKGLLHRFR